MDPLNDLIDARELDVRCRLCGWTGSRTVSWLSAHRDMSCPACASVIVLNTSEFKREIASLRRQVSALHRQLANIMPAEGRLVIRQRRSVPVAVSAASGEPPLLAAFRHGNKTAGKPQGVRRLRGDSKPGRTQ